MEHSLVELQIDVCSEMFQNRIIKDSFIPQWIYLGHLDQRGRMFQRKFDIQCMGCVIGLHFWAKIEQA